MIQLSRKYAIIAALLSVWQIDVVWAGEGLYFSNATHILYSEKPGDEAPTPVYTTENGRIVGLTVDVREKFIFWSDISMHHRAIYSAVITPTALLTQVQVIIDQDITEVNGLSVDWVSRHLYWTDARKHTIELSDYDGGNRRILFDTGLFLPRAIYADPAHGFLYWNDQGNHRIERSYLDGSDRQVIVSDSLKWPNQMTVYNEKLYWVDAWNKTLMSSDLDGGSPTQISLLSSHSLDNAVFGLAISRGLAYISVWYRGLVIKVNILTGETSESMTRQGYDALFSLEFAEERLQPMIDNPCGKDGINPCNLICLPVGLTDYRCSCPSYGGMALGNDGVTCRRPQELVVYALADVGVVGFFDPQGARTPDRYLVGCSSRPVAVTYDPADEMVYWSDVQQHAVFRASLDGKQREVFLGSNHSLGVVDGLALDNIHRKLYFSNMGMVVVEGVGYSWHKVEVVDLDHPDDAIRTVTESQKPRAVWVDADKGHLFYTDWGDQAQLVRTNLDGSSPTVVRSNLHNPNGITMAEGKLYMIDSHYKTRKLSNSKYPDAPSNGSLYSADEDGDSWGEITGLNLRTPFGLTAGGGKVFISDWEQQAIVEVDLDTTPETNVVITGVTSPMGLFYSSRRKAIDIDSTCSTSSCEDICLTQTQEAVCTCNSYDALMLDSDGQHCKLPASFVVVADLNSIKLIGLGSDDKSTYTVLQDTNYFANYVSLVYDGKRKAIYFSDVNRRDIYKASFDGSNSQVLYQGNHIIDGMFLDSFGEWLYWTDYLTGQVASIHLTASDVQKSLRVIATSLRKPRGISQHGTNVYVTEWGDPARVSRLTISTPSSLEVVMTRNLSIPNALFMDDDEGMMYIGDAGTKKVWRCGVTDWECSELWYMRGDVQQIYDLYKYGDILVYSDWHSGSLVQIHIDSGVKRVLATGLMRPSQMAFYLQDTPTCPSNHGCSDMCVAWLDGGHMCVCRPHRELGTDGKICRDPDTQHDQWLSLDPELCDQCTEGAACSQLVNTTIKKCVCKSGFEWNPEDEICSACEVNTYKAWLGDDECLSCPSAGTTSGTGRAECQCVQQLVWDSVRHTCTGNKIGHCPASTLYRGQACEKSCREESQCEGAQKCCERTDCPISQCLDPLDGLAQCVYQGVVYQVGEQFTPNACTSCTCQQNKQTGNANYGGAHCSVQDCPTLVCPIAMQYSKQGDCCPSCNDTQQIGDGLIFTDCPTLPGSKDPAIIEIDLPHGRSFVFHNLTLTTKDVLNLNRDVDVKQEPDVSFFPWAGVEEEHAWEIKVQATARRPGGSVDTAVCQYKLQVKDMENPEIRCPETRKVYTNTTEAMVLLQQPEVSDNVKIADDFPKASHQDDTMFTLGVHTITYTVEDVAGNSNHCSFKVQVLHADGGCAPVQVHHGSWQCIPQPFRMGGGMACNIRCDLDSARGPARPTLEDYRCNNSLWYPPLPSPVLSCVRVGPEHVVAILEILNLKCIDSPFLMPALYGSVHEYMTDKYPTQIIPFTITRRGCSAVSSMRKRDTNTMGLVFTFSIDVLSSEDAEALRSRVQAIVQRLSKAFQSGEARLWHGMDGEFTVTVFGAKCPLGQVPYRQTGQVVDPQKCMMCPVGHYHDPDSDTCKLCPNKTYNGKDGQTDCLACPAKHTSETGAISQTQCVEITDGTDGGTKDASSDKTNVALIAGAAAGAVALIIIILVIIVVVIKCRRVPKPPVLRPTSSDPTLHYENKAYEDLGAYAKDPVPLTDPVYQTMPGERAAASFSEEKDDLPKMNEATGIP